METEDPLIEATAKKHLNQKNLLNFHNVLIASTILVVCLCGSEEGKGTERRKERKRRTEIIGKR